MLMRVYRCDEELYLVLLQAGGCWAGEDIFGYVYLHAVAVEQASLSTVGYDASLIAARNGSWGFFWT